MLQSPAAAPDHVRPTPSVSTDARVYAMKLPLRNVTLSASFNAAGLLGGDAVANADDPNSSLYYWIGLGIVVGSAILSNLGVNVQKLSHVRVRHCHCCVMRVCLSMTAWACVMGAIVLMAVFVWIFFGGRRKSGRRLHDACTIRAPCGSSA